MGLRKVCSQPAKDQGWRHAGLSLDVCMPHYGPSLTRNTLNQVFVMEILKINGGKVDAITVRAPRPLLSALL